MRAAAMLRVMGLKQLVLYHDTHYHCEGNYGRPDWSLQPFETMKKDGTMTKPKAAKVLFPKIIAEMEQIVSIRDVYEQDKQGLVDQLLNDGIIWDLDAKLPPRPEIKLMRFRVPRIRRGSV